jgi:hypothetical protein
MKNKLLVRVVTLSVVAGASLATAATFTDDFNRADGALGSNWSMGPATPYPFVIASQQAVPEYRSDTLAGTYCTALQATADTHAVMSVDFKASYWTGNNGTPALTLGLNSDGSSSPFVQGSWLYVQGIVGVKFWVDGDWRDLTSGVSLVANDWYRAEVRQDGALFTGTIYDGSNTIVKQHTYTSALQTAATGYAFMRYLGPPGSDDTVRFDNFSFTVPEPASLALLGLAGLGLIARRRR